MEWIFSSSQLQETPSRRDGVSFDIETQYRKKTAWFIEELGKEMKCGRLVVSTALVLFHRFYSFQSFKQHNRFIIAVTCFFLASKVEEAPRKLRDIISTYFALRRKFNRSAPTESELKGMPNKILLAERILLQTLGFDLQLTHPYRACLDKIKDSLRLYIPSESRQGFHQNAVNFINDSYRTTLCLQYLPSQIALAAIFLASIQLSVKPLVPSKHRGVEQSWYELLEPEIDEDSLKSICMQIIDVIDDDSNSNMTATGERKEVAYLKNQIKLAEQSLKEAEDRSLKNKVEDSLSFIDFRGRKGREKDNSKSSSSISLSDPDRLGTNRNGNDDCRSTSQDTYDNGEMRRKQPRVSYPSSSQGVPYTPPVPRPGQSRQSSSSLASETPPPTPPDASSSSQHLSLPHTPRTPHAPGGPYTDTPEGNPAPPPPPTPTPFIEYQSYTRTNSSINNSANSSSSSSNISSSSMDDVSVDLPPSLLGSKDTDNPDHKKRRL